MGSVGATTTSVDCVHALPRSFDKRVRGLPPRAMSPERIQTFLDAFAPALVALVLLVIAFRIARALVPVRLPLGRLVRRLVPVAAVIAAGVWIAQHPPVLGLDLPRTPPLSWLLVAWLVAGLPVYVVWRHLRGAELREARERRIEAARGHERRRAPPPLPGSPTPRAPAPAPGPSAPHGPRSTP